MTEVQPPTYTETGCYTAAMDRALLSSLVCAEGVVGDGMEVTSNGESMTVTIAAGAAFIQGDTVEGQGIYHVVNDSPVTLDITGSDPTDSRIDLVVARVYDSAYEGTEDAWALEVIEGVPGPNPNEPALPDTALVLARVNIPAEAAVIPANNVIDYRAGYETCAASGRMLDEVIYTSSGSFNPANYPANATCYIEVIGGGGGGGGCGVTAANSAAAGSGGGGGGYQAGWVPVADMGGKAVTITVGSGGAGGSSGGGQPTDGGVSAFGTFVSTYGGKAGISKAAVTGLPTEPGGAGGAGATSSTHGTLSITGSPGDAAMFHGSADYILSIGNGGAAARGGGGGTTGGGDSGNLGQPGAVPGGGGSGAWNRHSQALQPGGAGARGVVIVTVYS